MSYVYQAYYGYGLCAGALEDLISDDFYDLFWEKVSANETELPYPFYCFEDNDGLSYIVVDSAPLISDEESPKLIKPYTFKEAATIIFNAFEQYICLDDFTCDKEELIEDLAKEFEHLSLVCSG